MIVPYLLELLVTWLLMWFFGSLLFSNEKGSQAKIFESCNVTLFVAFCTLIIFFILYVIIKLVGEI